jgi:hypothetical protein
MAPSVAVLRSMREQPGDPRTVERNLIRGAIDGAGRTLRCTGRIQYRYEVFGAREDTDVRLLVIPGTAATPCRSSGCGNPRLQPKPNGPFPEPEP